MRQWKAIIDGGIKYIFGIMMGLILVLCIFNQNVKYGAKRSFATENWVYLLCGVVVIWLLGMMVELLVKQTGKKGKDRVWMLLLNSLFGLVLLGVTYHYYFKVGWDAGLVIDQAKLLAQKDYEWLDHVYYARCSNNLFLTLLFSWVIKAGSMLGFGNYYFYLVAFQCVLWAALGYMVYEIADVLCAEKSSAVLAWLLFILFVGVSPWVTVPYTDSVAMFFLTAVVYFYCYQDSFPGGSFLLGMFLYVGTCVKPQIWILLIAYVIVEGPVFFVWCREQIGAMQHKRFSISKKAMLGASGFLVGLLLVKITVACSPYTLEEGKEYAMPHYLMQGMNQETNGIFCTEDVFYSESFPTQAERNAANYEEAFRRVKEMGPGGMLVHLQRKLLTTYSDGSLAWGVDGGFFEMKFYSGNHKLQEFFWELYFTDGKYFSYFMSYMQTLWMGILFFCSVSLWGKQKQERIQILALALIGVTMFELLFEPRGRHLMIYVPVMIVLACIGREKLTCGMRHERTVEKG